MRTEPLRSASRSSSLYAGTRGMSVDFDAGEVFEFSAHLGAESARAGAKAYVVVRMYGNVLQTRVKGKARGRPGPRAQTGDYNRSIGLVFGLGVDGISPAATVGTNAPQGRRLELGFEGTDSLGRIYHQPPYPHFGPALDEVTPPFVAAIASITDSLLTVAPLRLPVL